MLTCRGFCSNARFDHRREQRPAGGRRAPCTASRGAPFVAFNCGAISPLIERALRPDAGPSRAPKRRGATSRGNGGTFLDEITGSTPVGCRGLKGRAARRRTQDLRGSGRLGDQSRPAGGVRRKTPARTSRLNVFDRLPRWRAAESIASRSISPSDRGQERRVAAWSPEAAMPIPTTGQERSRAPQPGIALRHAEGGHQPGAEPLPGRQAHAESGASAEERFEGEEVSAARSAETGPQARLVSTFSCAPGADEAPKGQGRRAGSSSSYCSSSGLGWYRLHHRPFMFFS